MTLLMIILFLIRLDYMSSFIKLYAYDISNYCSSVKIALQYKELSYIELPPPDGYGSNEYKKIVMMGTIPALVITNDNDDFVISESQVILEYLDQKFPTTKQIFLSSIIIISIITLSLLLLL